MLNLLSYSLLLANPMGLAIAEFLVWEVFSDGRWKQRQEQSNPAKHWQDQALAATRELRELEITSRRQMDEMESRFRKEQKQKER